MENISFINACHYPSLEIEVIFDDGVDLIISRSGNIHDEVILIPDFADSYTVYLEDLVNHLKTRWDVTDKEARVISDLVVNHLFN